MRPRDLETLEFPRVLQAIAALARSPAGQGAVCGLSPTADGTVADRRLDEVAELVVLSREAGRVPTADVPLLAPILGAAAPDGAVLEPRRLAEVRDFLGTVGRVRAHLRRDSTRFPRLATLAASLGDLAVVREPLARTLDEMGLVRDDASPTLAAARAAGA